LMVMMAFLILSMGLLSLAVGVVVRPAGVVMNRMNAGVAGVALGSAESLGRLPGAWMKVTPEKRWKDGLVIFDMRFGGQAVHVDAGGGVMIDGGSEGAFFDVVGGALGEVGARADTLVATHNDEEHVGGFLELLERGGVKQILVPQDEVSHTLKRVVEAGEGVDARVIGAGLGRRLVIEEGVDLEVVWDGRGESGRAEDRGLVLRLHWAGWRILFTGDGGYLTERALLERGIEVEAEVWVCGRNRNDLVGSPAFVRAVNPEVVVFRDTFFPVHERVSAGWMRWLESEGVELFDQAEEGAVYVKPREGALEVPGQVRGRKVVVEDD
ncbi:MAG: MBL fold metallo-hydrolase, partial [Verrucomicrobiota bacterium]